MLEKFCLAIVFTLSLYLFLQTNQSSAKPNFIGNQTPIFSPKPTLISHFFAKNNLHFPN